MLLIRNVHVGDCFDDILGPQHSNHFFSDVLRMSLDKMWGRDAETGETN